MNVRFGFLSLAAIMLLSVTAIGQEPKADDAFFRQYWLDAKVFSFRPGAESSTFRSFSGGGVESGTLTLGISDKQRHFDVRIMAKLKAQRFMANVAVKPTKEDTQTKPHEIDYDLSDLAAQSLEIARDDDGRIYRLSLIPSIREKPMPKQFQVTELRLEYWSFPSSPSCARTYPTAKSEASVSMIYRFVGSGWFNTGAFVNAFFKRSNAS